jgi:membrane protease YdiL (CAAX protease family)
MSFDDVALSGSANAVTISRRRRDLLELSVGYALILLVLWTPRPWQRLLYCAAAVFLVTVLWMSFDGWRAMGLRIGNLGRSIWVVGVALAVAAIAVFVAQRMHTLQHNGGVLPFLKRYWGYAIWAFAQQVLLQDFFLLRLLRLMRSPVFAALAAAAIFSLAHLPSPILTVVTFVWGFAACLLFLHYRNLYPLAIAHAIFGITIAVTVPGPVVRNMRVGLGYLTYASHHGHHHRR